MLLVDLNIYNGLVDLWIYIYDLVKFDIEILNFFDGKSIIGAAVNLTAPTNGIYMGDCCYSRPYKSYL